MLNRPQRHKGRSQEAWYCLTKGFHDTKEQVFSFDWFLLPPGDPREEPDQESDSGEEDVREHSGCGRHLQEENTGDQVEHALGQIYFKNVDKYI